MEYGPDFKAYRASKEEYFINERRKEAWLWVGIGAQCFLILFGGWLVPTYHLFTWSIVAIVSLTISLWGLLSIWWKQRQYTSFDRWIKYHGNKNTAQRTSSRCCQECRCKKL